MRMATGRRKRNPSHEYTDAARGERLQKVLAAAGVASRRACEQLIEQGLVTVNGQVVKSLPAWVDAEKDRIVVDGRPIARHRKTPGAVGGKGHVYVALYKPRDVISTTRDEFGRQSVTDLVELPTLTEGEAQPRLYPVGRLDAEATGLVLLTNDGELAHRLTHPSYEVPKQYEVSVRGRVTSENVQQLLAGLNRAYRPRRPGKKPPRPTKSAIAPGPRAAAQPASSPVEVRILGSQRDEEHGERTALSITLTEGPDREIKWVLKRLGFPVRRLKRTAIGPISLKGIAIRRWRLLTPGEVKQLRKLVGLAKE
jgi:23S rRNA pseudouridine2605 synthase